MSWKIVDVQFIAPVLFGGASRSRVPYAEGYSVLNDREDDGPVVVRGPSDFVIWKIPRANCITTWTEFPEQPAPGELTEALCVCGAVIRVEDRGKDCWHKAPARRKRAKDATE